MVAFTTKISVIMVCFNSEGFIADAIKSIQNQSYKNFELIIIDGGSTDRTLATINSFREIISILISEPDKGIYDAMNKGLQWASGDLICFLNSDDYFKDNNVLASVASYSCDYNYDALMTDVEIVSRKHPKKLLRKYSGRKMSLAKMKWGIMPPHPGVFLRKHVFCQSGNFNTSYKIAGDFDLLYRVFSLPTVKVGYLPLTSVIMRSGGASASGLHSKLLLNSEVRKCLVEKGIKFTTLRLIIKYLYKVTEVISSRVLFLMLLKKFKD